MAPSPLQCIAIVTDDPGWHGSVLREAFAARGFESRFVSLTEARLDLSRDFPVVLPGFEQRPPQGVFVRGVPGGTLEQVILRLDMLHALRDLGVTVYNDARAIERTVDKAMTSLLLKRAGLRTPDTWVCESVQAARAIAVRETAAGRALVMKPLFGSQGVGICRVDHPEDLPDRQSFGDVYYLQSLIPNDGGEWRDWRVLVIDGQAVAAMQRRSSHWITNRARGGRCHPVELDAPLTGLAEAAARAVQIDYAGIDLMQEPDGRFLVTEVNSIPAWRGLQGVSTMDIARALVDHFLSRVAAGAALEALA